MAVTDIEVYRTLDENSYKSPTGIWRELSLLAVTDIIVRKTGDLTEIRQILERLEREGYVERGEDMRPHFSLAAEGYQTFHGRQGETFASLVSEAEPGYRKMPGKDYIRANPQARSRTAVQHDDFLV